MNIKYFLTSISFVVDNEIEKNELKNFIEKETGVKSIAYYTISEKKNNISDYYTIIMTQKNGKYKITVKSTYFYDIINLNYETQEKTIDLFNIDTMKTSYNHYYDGYYGFTSSGYNKFLDLQSLLAKYLIYKKTRNDTDKNMFIFTGTYSYPPFNNINYGYYSIGMVGIIFSGIISFELSIATYFFNVRMIDEKEKKLTGFLERQGVSKKYYFFSWLFSYVTLMIFSLFVFIIFALIYLIYYKYLFLIDLVFFILSLFSVCYFFSTCIESVKTVSIAIKFYNFSTPILGVAISFLPASKISKIIFSFVPQINIFFCTNAVFQLQIFESLSWEKLWLKSKKISFMESIIMYIVEIIFYFSLSLFIQSYKDSGLDFILFIKSFFKKVSRKIEVLPENKLINEENIINHETHHQELSAINQQKKQQNQCLNIVNVTKKFESLKAVNNFNGELFSDEIFCLLGHNGAGKTTLISIISGIIDPNQGDIFYNGTSLVTNKSYLYENIGLCQQEDIFFEYLTVQEHLEYLCEIKGRRANINEIEELIRKIE